MEALQQNPTRLPIYQLVVADEAHRAPHRNSTESTRAALTQLEAILRSGRVVVCLVDEGQTLNEDDAGTRQNIRTVWETIHPGTRLLELSLAGQHRQPIGQAKWLENFLEGRLIQRPPEYEMVVLKTAREVIAWLRARAMSADCGLLASYTRSDGRNGRTLRVENPPIHWLMEKEEYAIWWRNRAERHKFTCCESVYGCQGLDLDYAGVIWGRDLAVRMEGERVRFNLCAPHEITDDIGLAYGQKLAKLAEEATRNPETRRIVVDRLIHRYRILLSRGRKGTVIACEEPGTADALRKCLAASAI